MSINFFAWSANQYDYAFLWFKYREECVLLLYYERKSAAASIADTPATTRSKSSDDAWRSWIELPSTTNVHGDAWIAANEPAAAADDHAAVVGSSRLAAILQ